MVEIGKDSDSKSSSWIGDSDKELFCQNPMGVPIGPLMIHIALAYSIDQPEELSASLLQKTRGGTLL